MSAWLNAITIVALIGTLIVQILIFLDRHQSEE